MISLSPTPFSRYFSRSIMPHFVILFPGLEGEVREWTDVASHSSLNKDIFGLQWAISWETIFYHNPGSFYSFYPIASNAVGFSKHNNDISCLSFTPESYFSRGHFACSSVSHTSLQNQQLHRTVKHGLSTGKVENRNLPLFKLAFSILGYRVCPALYSFEKIL